MEMYYKFVLEQIIKLFTAICAFAVARKQLFSIISQIRTRLPDLLIRSFPDLKIVW